MLVAELRYHLVPVCRVAQDRGGDPSSSGSGKQARGGVALRKVEPAHHEVTDLFDQRNSPGTLTLGAFVDETAWARGGLSSDCPGPRPAVDVSDTNAGYFPYSRRRACSEDHYVAPSRKFAGPAFYECGGKALSVSPSREARECAWVVQLVFSSLVDPLPSGNAGGVAVDDAVTNCLFEDAYEDRQAVLHR